jgi:hypothetical protein
VCRSWHLRWFCQQVHRVHASRPFSRCSSKAKLPLDDGLLLQPFDGSSFSLPSAEEKGKEQGQMFE